MASTSDRTPRPSALGLALAVCAALFLAHAAGFFRVPDLRIEDLFFRLRGEEPTDDRIALVTIDDETLRAYDRWPLPRDTYALLLRTLEDAGALAVGLDLLFLDAKEEERTRNLLLATVTGQYTNVVHAIAAVPVEPDAPADIPTTGRDRGVAPPRIVEAEPVSVPRTAEIALPFSQLAEAASQLGHVSVILDADGTVRRVPLLLRHDRELWAAMGLRLVALAEAWPQPLTVHSAPGGFTIAGPGGRARAFRIDREGGFAFPFAGDRSAFPRTHSMIDVLQGAREGRTEDLKEAFGGRIVLVGVTAVGEAAADVGATPFAAATPLVYVHANLVNALLAERTLVDAPRRPVLVGAALVAAVLGVAVVALPFGWAVTSAVVLLLLLGGAEFLALTRSGLRIAPTPTLLLAPVVGIVVAAFRLFFLERSVREWEPVVRTLRSFRGRLFPGSARGGEDGRREIGNYRLEELLGRGGMGEVWRASHHLLERPAAVKLIRRDALGVDSPTRALDVLQRFEREVQATASLQSEHTVDIYDFGVDEESTFFYVMELLDGVPLDELVQRFGPVAPERAIHLLLQACDSLREAHDRGLVHRDIKPANILTCRKGNRVDHVKVVDFGLVKRSEDFEQDSALTRRGTLSGTPAYMSPEQAMARTDIDARADLYALGCVGYWLLTGMPVFRQKNPMELLFAHAHEKAVPPSQLAEVPVPDDLERAIMSCLEKDPAARPDSAADLAARLQECGSHGQWTGDRAQAWWSRHLPQRGPVAAAPAGSDDETVRL